MKFLGNPQSGSFRGDTSSRNRNGQYYRNRATPVQPRTPAQLAVRARLAGNAAAWRALTDGQRAGWLSLGLQMTRTDSLGQVYSLTGFQSYCSVNNNNLAAGNSVVSAAPLLETPPSLLTMTLTLTDVTFSVAYTTTPLATGMRLFLFVSPQASAGVNFNGDYRLAAVTAAAAASPHNLLATYTAKFGAPVTGNKIFVSGQVYSSGFLSAPLNVGQIVA